MKESTQTLCFLGAAVATVFLAIVTMPSDATFDVTQLAGKLLNEPFEPEEAKSLRIVRFDEETATLKEFEVAEEDGVWSLPSKGGYPADADQQMARASTSIMDREILRVVSQSASTHGDYGVVAPSEELDIDATGVGTRVTLADDTNDALVDLVVGKEVKDAKGQRYVRRISQDVVYIAEIDLNNLSTNFSDWIEDDLLKLDPADIASVQIKDYSAELVQRNFTIRIALEPKSDLTLAYDDQESKWIAHELLEAADTETKEYIPFELSDNQELNTEKLDALKTALGDLLIVDVEKKPEGLSEALKKGDDFAENQDSGLNLIRHGFAPARNEAGETNLHSTEGEVICTLKEGVEYVLRFGNLQADSQEKAKAVEGEAAPQVGVNRYLFVMARLNDSTIELPELEEVPDLPEGADKSSANEAEEEANSEADSTGENEPSDEKTAEKGTDEADADDTETDEASTGDESDADEEIKQLIADRNAIIRRNQQKTDVFQDRREAAKNQVQRLNARFGDWYYVIPNEVYQKVRLGKEDVVITKPNAAAEEAGSNNASDPNSGEFGAPGSAIPGLPAIP